MIHVYSDHDIDECEYEGAGRGEGGEQGGSVTPGRVLWAGSGGTLIPQLQDPQPLLHVIWPRARRCYHLL